jgi:hypothetical protein
MHSPAAGIPGFLVVMVAVTSIVWVFSLNVPVIVVLAVLRNRLAARTIRASLAATFSLASALLLFVPSAFEPEVKWDLMSFVVLALVMGVFALMGWYVGKFIARK